MIAIRDLHKTLGPQAVLCGIDLDVPAGEVVALVGPSGTGKSVLLKHIVGLLRPDQGDVMVGGTSVSRCSRQRLFALRRRMGYAFQDAALLDSLSVYENLLLALDDDIRRDAAAADKSITTALARVNLGRDVLAKFPSEMSGGMRKRAGVARAVIHDPSIVLYDEPTTGLDPRNAEQVNELIRRIADETKATCVVVTHDLAALDTFADRVICLTDGRIVFDGDPAAFEACAVAPVARRTGIHTITRMRRSSWS